MPSFRHSEECEARRENLINNNYKNKTQNNMKKTLYPATYESPQAEVMVLETEGAILQGSYLEGVGHNSFTEGDDILV